MDRTYTSVRHVFADDVEIHSLLISSQTEIATLKLEWAYAQRINPINSAIYFW